MVKSVDLISGIGGTLGLWLGLSFLSLGTFCIETAWAFFAKSLPPTRGPQAVFSTLIGRGPTRLGSHWSRASAVLCHKERARVSKAPF